MDKDTRDLLIEILDVLVDLRDGLSETNRGLALNRTNEGLYSIHQKLWPADEPTA